MYCPIVLFHLLSFILPASASVVYQLYLHAQTVSFRCSSQSLFCLFVFDRVDASTDETDMDLRDCFRLPRPLRALEML